MHARTVRIRLVEPVHAEIVRLELFRVVRVRSVSLALAVSTRRIV